MMHDDYAWWKEKPTYRPRYRVQDGSWPNHKKCLRFCCVLHYQWLYLNSDNPANIQLIRSQLTYSTSVHYNYWFNEYSHSSHAGFTKWHQFMQLSKICFRPTFFFRPIIFFWSKFFFDPTFCVDSTSFFDPKFFLDPKFFWNFFWSQNFFGTKIFLDQNFFFKQKKIFGPKSF